MKYNLINFFRIGQFKTYQSGLDVLFFLILKMTFLIKMFLIMIFSIMIFLLYEHHFNDDVSMIFLHCYMNINISSYEHQSTITYLNETIS